MLIFQTLIESLCCHVSKTFYTNFPSSDPVSPVKLTVDSVSSSSDSCNLTVTCSTPDSHISSTFTCDTKTCSQEGGERSVATISAASLHVYLVNGSISCNHSNQISWTEDIKKAEHLCTQHAGKTEKQSNLLIITHSLELSQTL